MCGRTVTLSDRFLAPFSIRAIGQEQSFGKFTHSSHWDGNNRQMTASWLQAQSIRNLTAPCMTAIYPRKYCLKYLEIELWPAIQTPAFSRA